MSATTVTPPSSPKDSKIVPVPAHLIPLPDSRPPTPDVKEHTPNQSPSSSLPIRETDNEDKDTPDPVRDSVKDADVEAFAFSFAPNIRPITQPGSLSRPPPFTVRDGDAVVNERMRKAFCSQTRRPLVPLRSYSIPTPASFGEVRESLEARRAKLKRAGHSLYQIKGDNARYRVNPDTGAWEIPFIADQAIPIKNIPTYAIRVRCKERDSTGSSSTKVVSFIAHKHVVAAFFAHLGPKLESSVTISRKGHSTGLVRRQWLPVLTVNNGKPDVYEFLLEYAYEQDPELILRSLLGDRVYPQVSLCTEEIYQGTPRTISALPIAERRAAVQVEEEHAYEEIAGVLLFLDEIFDLADELGLEAPPFWNALACVRRIILDAGAISYLHQLEVWAAAEAEAASST